MLGAPISGALMKIHWLGYSGWRWLLILEGLPAVILGFVTLFYLTDRPEQAHWLRDDERAWIVGELAREKQAKKKGPNLNAWRSFFQRDVLLLTLAYFLGSTVQYGFGIWLPKIIQRLSGFNSFEVSAIAAIPFLVSFPAMLFVGWNSDRTGERRWHAAAAYLATGVGLAGSLLTGSNVTFAMVMFSITAMGSNGRLPAFWALPPALLAGTSAAACIGAINCVGNLGGFVGPYVLGFLSTYSGGSYASGVLFLSITAAVAAVLVVLVRRPAVC
jgi:ACS family tartrate transporter-like MFS transporter